MSTKMNKFLEFNGRTIYYLDVNGTNWIAIKPICEVLGVDYNCQYLKITNHKSLSERLTQQKVVAADERIRKMVCLPEKDIYGWVLSINSKSENLAEYKQIFCKVIFDHFNPRKKKCLDNDARIAVLKKELQEDPQYQQLQLLLKKKKEIKKKLRELDLQLLR